MTFSEPMHMTPAQVAKYNRKRRVGREYASERDILNASTELQQLGILTLILRAIEDSRIDAKYEDNFYMNRHKYFLLSYRSDVEKTLRMVADQQSRIRDLFAGVTLNVTDMEEPNSIDWYGELFRSRKDHSWYGSFAKNFRELKDRLARLRSVKTIEDISKLKGYGKKRSAAIIAKVKDRGTK